MGTESHWDDRYNKIYYRDFVRYYANNKPDYGVRAGVDNAVSAAQSNGATTAPVVVLARPRRHKLPRG